MGRAVVVVVPRSATNAIHRIFRPRGEALRSWNGFCFVVAVVVLKNMYKKTPVFAVCLCTVQGLFLFLFYRCVTPENQDEETLPEEPRRALPAAKLKRAAGCLTRRCFQQHLRNRVFLIG